YGQAVAGELLPADAVTDPAIINGYIAPGGTIELPPAETPSPEATPIPQPTSTPEPEDSDDDDDLDDEAGEPDDEEFENDIYLPFITIGSAALGGMATIGMALMAFFRPQE
ncbi:MAG: hypothetical protein AAF902_19115, partial [Chloroflexota bacterium]